MDLVRSAGRAHFTDGGWLTHIAMERYYSGGCRDSLYVRRHPDAAASCTDCSLHYGRLPLNDEDTPSPFCDVVPLGRTFTYQLGGAGKQRVRTDFH